MMMMVVVTAAGHRGTATSRCAATGRSATTSRCATTGRSAATGHRRGCCRGARSRRTAGAVGDIRVCRHCNVALCQTMNRGRRRHRRRRADIGGAADRDVVTADVHGVGGKALAGRCEHCFVGRQRGAGIAVQDAREPP